MNQYLVLGTWCLVRQWSMVHGPWSLVRPQSSALGPRSRVWRPEITAQDLASPLPGLRVWVLTDSKISEFGRRRKDRLIEWESCSPGLNFGKMRGFRIK